MLPLVLITWTDAVGADGWITPEELDDITLTVHNTAGFLFKETEDSITVVMSYNDDMDNLGAYVVIPKVNIQVMELFGDEPGGIISPIQIS